MVRFNVSAKTCLNVCFESLERTHDIFSDGALWLLKTVSKLVQAT